MTDKFNFDQIKKDIAEIDKMTTGIIGARSRVMPIFKELIKEVERLREDYEMLYRKNEEHKIFWRNQLGETNSLIIETAKLRAEIQSLQTYKDNVESAWKIFRSRDTRKNLGNPEPPDLAFTHPNQVIPDTTKEMAERRERSLRNSEPRQCAVCLQFFNSLAVRGCEICSNIFVYCPECWDGHETEHPNVY